MIAKLTGVVDSLLNSALIVDVGGVGYLVQTSGRTLGRIGTTRGSPVSLLIETIVREDQFTLYGFCDAIEKEWFQILCTVQGVGPRAALSILSAVQPEQLVTIIAAQDKTALRRAEGVGEKLALRIVTELKEKAHKMSNNIMTSTEKESSRGKLSGMQENIVLPPSLSGDAVSALVNLGYGRAEAFGTVSGIVREKGDELSLSELIRESLRELSA